MAARQPAIMFYTADWLADPSLRACSLAARGLWFDMLCMMHQAGHNGQLVHANGERIDETHLARLVGDSRDVVTELLDELRAAGVFSESDGVIVCRRIQRDEHRREVNRENGRRGGNPRLMPGTGKDADAERIRPVPALPTDTYRPAENGDGWAEFLAVWNSCPAGKRGVTHFHGLHCPPRLREAFAIVWHTERRKAAERAMQLIVDGAIEWDRSPITLVEFLSGDEIDKIIGGSHAKRTGTSVGRPVGAGRCTDNEGQIASAAARKRRLPPD